MLKSYTILTLFYVASIVQCDTIKARSTTERVNKLLEMDLHKYRIFSGYEIQPDFHEQFMLASMRFRNATLDSYYNCLSQCEHDEKCIITVIKLNECHLYTNELVTNHVKLCENSRIQSEGSDAVEALARDGYIFKNNTLTKHAL
jgi:hypothetical protein